MIDRNQAYNLMCEWVKNEALQRHMLYVEAAMRAYARKYGEDEQLWGIAGLVHDMDYERHPGYDVTNQTGHPYEAVREFKRLGFPEAIVDAILGHALYSGIPRTSQMAKCLFACDELCGFLVACALVRPGKFEGMETKSVKKKLKNKDFAAKVNREDIALGIQELGIPEDEHINFVINVLRIASSQIGF